MGLLEDGADIDYRVDVLAGAGVPADGRLWVLLQKIAKLADRRIGRCRVARSGKGEDAKTSVSFDDVAQVNRLGVGQPDDWRQ